MRSGTLSPHGADPEAPIIIGGLGGSGTRIAAELLQRSGVHLGHNLNAALDNLTATVLFNRPAWVRSSSGAKVDDTFRRIRRMVLADGVTARDRSALVVAALRNGHSDSAKWRLRYAAGAGSDLGPGPNARAWGWKEPNSHLFLQSLDRVFTKLRFVYVVRHPLDMAFSRNTYQLQNWAHHFDIATADRPGGMEQAQLDWWIASTTHAMTTGPELLGERFYLLHYDHLLEEPLAGTRSLLAFSGLENEDEIDEIATAVQRPESAGRHEDRDLSILRSDQLDRIAEMGW